MPTKKKSTTKKKATGSKTCARVKGHTKAGKKVTTYARKKAKK